MNRQKLTELIQYPERINTRDISMLTEMAEQYPYATAIQILLAKSKQQQPDARQSLATAALYSPNRGVLRQVMENTLPPLASSPTNNTAVTTTPVDDVKHPYAPPADPVNPDPEQSLTAVHTDVNDQDDIVNEGTETEHKSVPDKADVFEELQKNLRRLREERSRWHTGKGQGPDNQSSASEGKTDEQSPQAVTSTSVNYMPTTTLQQIIEDHQEQPLENPRIQAQRSLIDSFLENGGNLQRRQQLQGQPNDEVTDLTQNTSYTPQDLATETLAKIMERQGKIEKALDIYQKLSLKYPQKSAYFANCIERLKKDS